MNSPVMQGLTLNTPSYVKNARLIAWVADMAALCKPDTVVWCDGSDEEYHRLCELLSPALLLVLARPVGICLRVGGGLKEVQGDEMRQIKRGVLGQFRNDHRNHRNRNRRWPETGQGGGL